MICLCIFISLAPELVIYDNACRLHEYCLNRDPAFFKKTKFVVDKFHWKNHSGKLPYSSYFTWSELIDPKMAVFMFSQNLLIYNCPLCVGCCEGYNMKLYPMLNMYNSQAAEQCNSCIKPLASMVSYMEYDNFFLFTKLHIWHRNMLRIVKYNPEREIAYKDYFLTLSRVIH